MDNNVLKNSALQYCEHEKNDVFKTEVEDLLAKEDWAELDERFYTSLSFGTGGLRGIIGGGFNRINTYMIAKATAGLAAYIKDKSGAESPSCVIAHDSRNYSPEFALEAALVLASAGIKAYVFDSLRPTPELSFAVRELGATAGIVITASHNPPEYNGYKVYWADGGQIVPPHDNGIIAEVNKVEGAIARLEKDEALNAGLLQYIGKDVDDKFIAVLKEQIQRPELFDAVPADFSVAFTPLHGTGVTILEPYFKELGLTCHIVAEQKAPNGDFPTVDYPNPEEAAALKMVCDLGEKHKSPIVMGTDPDADRIGLGVWNGSSYTLLNGNQLGSLLGEYIFTALKEKGKLSGRYGFVKTIVTTGLQTKIAESFGAETYDVLTGFKYIAEKIRQFEDEGIQYIFGGEESYGFLNHTHARDKDAVGAAALAAEMALYYYNKGINLLDQLDNIHKKYGFYQEILISKTFKGKAGVETIASLMAAMRANPLTDVMGEKLVEIRDIKEGLSYAPGKKDAASKLELPSSNVLQLVFEGGTIVTCRPSGTEPKIKFYASVNDSYESKDKVLAKLENIKEQIDQVIASL